MIPVEGHSGLYRDEATGAIINCNENQYSEYLRFKETRINEKRELEQVKSEISELKKLVAELINGTK